jgi:Protein of unknown function (DUF3108)
VDYSLTPQQLEVRAPAERLCVKFAYNRCHVSRTFSPDLTAPMPVLRSIVTAAFALACATVAAAPAAAQSTLHAHYGITMTGVTIGEITWQADIGSTSYTASASGKASGVLSVLVNGEGAVTTAGNIANGRLAPSSFTSTTTDDEGTIKLQMTFADGVATEQIAPQPPVRKDRLPVTDADRRGVTDPLSAVLIPTKAGPGVLSSSDCNHLLMIFDGRRRYNLVLRYGRMSKVTVTHGYAGPILVCGVILQPIAGYRSDSLLVKYVAGRRDMELWFAPVGGSAVMAPVRVLMPTLIGTLKIEADRFEAAATPAPPAPAAVQSSPLPPAR